MNNLYAGNFLHDGVIFHVWQQDNRRHALVMSFLSKEKLQWQTIISMDYSNSTFDGKSNTIKMTNSPAKRWIYETFGENSGWYLPSIDELALLWHNRFLVNRVLSANQKTLLPFGNHWSSTENREKNMAFSFSFEQGLVIPHQGKLSGAWIRPVKMLSSSLI